MRWRHGRERTAERTISVHSLASIRLFSRRVQVYAWTCSTRKSWAWQAAACYRHGKAPAAVTRWCPMQTWPSGYLRPGATPADNEPLARLLAPEGCEERRTQRRANLFRALRQQ